MIVITGASDGLGKALAKLYKEAGKKVVNISRRECVDADVNILQDLSVLGAVKLAAQDVLEIDEPLEAVVMCAGVMTVEDIGELSQSEIERLMNVNANSQALLASLLASRIENDSADVVLVSSTTGTKGVGNEVLYATSKWAVRGLAKSLQDRYKATSVRVISFCPGGFKSGIAKKAKGIDNTKSGPWMEAEDVALALKQTLDLPKSMEVSEIVINRKQAA